MNNLGDVFKAQFLMNQQGNMMYGFIILAVIEFFSGIIRECTVWIKKSIDDYLKSKLQRAVNITTTMTGVKPLHELIFERNFKGNGNWDKADAIIAHVLKVPESQSLMIVSSLEIIKSDTPFKIDRDIYFKLLDLTLDTDGSIKNVRFKLYSTEIDVCQIRDFVNRLVEGYLIDKKNNLGEKLYYFDHIVEKKGPREMPNKKLMFSKHLFESNRNLDNVYHERSEELKTRVRFFLENKEWYNTRGIPHTLGLMLYGPPGTGKTSCVKAIANEAHRHVININLGAVRTKKQLKKLFYDERIEICDNMDTNHTTEYIIPINKRLYLIEDIDAIDNDMLLKRDRESTQTLIKNDYLRDIMNNETDDIPDLDLSCILNIIDGTLETPGRILIITTNFPEKLDDAFIRPGRIDLLLEYKNCNHKMITDMFRSFYGSEPNPAIVATIKEYEWSPAEVGQVLFRCFNKPSEALGILTEGKKVLFEKASIISNAQDKTPDIVRITNGVDSNTIFNEKDDEIMRQIDQKHPHDFLPGPPRPNIPTETYTLQNGYGTSLPDSPYMTGWSEPDTPKSKLPDARLSLSKNASTAGLSPEYIEERVLNKPGGVKNESLVEKNIDSVLAAEMSDRPNIPTETYTLLDGYSTSIQPNSYFGYEIPNLNPITSESRSVHFDVMDSNEYREMISGKK